VVYRIAVVIPARTCPCRQIASVLEQLTFEDRLIIAYSPEVADCCNRRVTSSRTIWISTGPSVGAGAARNIGARAIQEFAKVILFCDADDQIASGWLTLLANPLLNSTADLVGGGLRIGRGSTSTVVIPTVDYWHSQALFGANMGITQEAWLELSGFDESLGCCEDTDLAWRASKLGFKIQVVPEALVEYSLRPPIEELRQRFRWGRSSIQLLRKHHIELDHLPGLRQIISDKRASGFAASPLIAALAQFAGQRIESRQTPVR
jgi:cellulose synthase/poly-beta-1,6-N-acetylglucosamine synthase-like glycosyltransferase